MKVLFAAGGTGGHINPALSVAHEIRTKIPDSEILFVGTKEKMEARLVPDAGFDFTTIKISGFQRRITIKNIFRNICTIFNLIISYFQVNKLLKSFQPDVVVGFGGYVSGPVLRAAAKKGIKTVIHEQNAFPGMANKALAKIVDKTLISVPEAGKLMQCKNPPILTGLPVRAEILNADRATARKKLGIPENTPLIFSTGGSLGAKAVNEAMYGVISAMKNDNVHFIHGCGKSGIAMIDRLKNDGIIPSENIDVREYVYDMADCLAAADIVVSRAGASSIAELQALGKASILIPSPFVAENHQYHNAMALVNQSAALIIEEKNLTADALTKQIRDLLANKNLLDEIGKNARSMAKLNAKQIIGDEILDLINYEN